MEQQVHIVSFRGTIYGVFSSKDRAWQYAELKFGRNAMMCLDVTILSREVDKVVL